MKRKHVTSVSLEEDGHYWVRCSCRRLSIDGPLTFRADANKSRSFHEEKTKSPSRYEPEAVLTPRYYQ